MDPLQFSPITLPITLVCAGNRRKEQNVFRQSLGFSWGPAGLSTGLFTGVYLADILERVCPQNFGTRGEEGFRKAEHVIFEGAEDLPDGKYGTSQLLRWSKDKGKGMMIAWAMNGEVRRVRPIFRKYNTNITSSLSLFSTGFGTRSWIPTSTCRTWSNWWTKYQMVKEDYC